ncbi:hypothetical protein SDC9_126721 [bioreactor metagenome]|uniref:Uncharacterized protein n=1 Tax=bioreactor metagenome TaxID=1076179 RepID=A0A645CSM0_9ZZZZ
MTGLFAVGLVAFEIVHRRADLIAGLLAGTGGVHGVPQHQQGLEGHHGFVIFGVVTGQHQNFLGSHVCLHFGYRRRQNRWRRATHCGDIRCLSGSSRLLRDRELAAANRMAFDAGRLEAGEELGEQGLCTPAVVAAEVADIQVQRDGADFRPGMNRQVRLGQDDRAGHACRLPRRIAKCMEQPADDCQAMALAGVHAIDFQARGIEQSRWGAAAVVQVGDQVQSVHDVILWRST